MLYGRRVCGFLALTMVLAASGTVLNQVGAEEHVEVCRYCQVSPFSAASDSAGRKYAPDRQVDVLHIKLDVTPNFDDRTIGGTTTLSFKPISKPLREFRLDAVDLTISDVRGSAEVESFSATDQDLTIVFAEEIPVGQEASVEIDHSAQPTRGFYFRTPEMGYPESDTHVWTQGETHEARHWFPCFDYPNERSSTEVICHVPRDMTVLSNGERLSEEFDEETNLKAVRWLQEKPHVSYLICLVAGYFEKLEDIHRNVPLAFYTQPTLIDHAPNSFVDTASIMAFFEEEIGLEFPWNKYYQVTIRDFTAGGMENTTLTTLTHRTIFAKDTENIRSTRSLDAHEMAHQWFGDYVTCKDWSHLWLNEGFATYYAHLYEGHKFGRDALLHGLYRDATGRVLPAGEKDKRPIVYNDYRNPGEQFDFRSYPKGSWVLHMLRSQLGEPLYRQCIKTYLENHALTSVVTEELNSVIEEVSGQSFDKFFDQWVYHGGHPELQVSYRWQAADKLARVTVRQTQEVDDDVLLFEFPTKLRFILKDGQVIDRDVQIDRDRHDFYVSLPSEPKIVRFDPEYTVLAKVAFKKSDSMLMEQLKNEHDVIGRLQAAKELEKRKTLKSVAALEEALQNDPFYGVRRAAADALRKIGNDEAFEALLASRDQSDARVRLRVVDNLGHFYRDDAKEALVNVVEQESNPAIASEAITSLGKYQEEPVTELIRRTLRSESFRNQLAMASVRALGSQADSANAGELLKVLKDREQEFPNRSLGGALNTLAKLARDSDEHDEVLEYLNEFVADTSSPIRSYAIRALGTLGDKRSAAMLEALSADDRSDRIASAAKSALEAVQKETQFVPSEVTELRKQLAELRTSQEELREELERLSDMNEARGEGRYASHETTDGDDDQTEDEADQTDDKVADAEDDSSTEVRPVKSSERRSRRGARSDRGDRPERGNRRKPKDPPAKKAQPQP